MVTKKLMFFQQNKLVGITYAGSLCTDGASSMLSEVSFYNSGE